jgi:hypothetical protein
VNFWNSFQLRIHKNQTLSKLERFKYLKPKLSGPALINIERLPFADSDYDQAIHILCHIFAKKTPFLNEHLQEIFS